MLMHYNQECIRRLNPNKLKYLCFPMIPCSKGLFMKISKFNNSERENIHKQINKKKTLIIRILGDNHILVGVETMDYEGALFFQKSKES